MKKQINQMFSQWKKSWKKTVTTSCLVTEHIFLHSCNVLITTCFTAQHFSGQQSHLCNRFCRHLPASNVHIHWQTSGVCNLRVICSWHHHSLWAFRSLTSSVFTQMCCVHRVQGNFNRVLSLECVGLWQDGISTGNYGNPTLYRLLL